MKWHCRFVGNSNLKSESVTEFAPGELKLLTSVNTTLNTYDFCTSAWFNKLGQQNMAYSCLGNLGTR
jgi:hypothetical protein